jgi:DNA-binding NarL/FixJ family response regulator
MKNMKKKILIADDHYIVQAGTGFLIEQKLSYPNTVDFADSFTEVQEKISNEQYDLLILDIDMPDSIFKAMIKTIKNIQPNLKILIFSGYNEEIGIQYILEGADGYIKKTSNEPELINAITLIFTQGYYYPEAVMYKIMNHPQSINPIEKLSKREHEIFELLVKGNGNLEICTILNIKMSTISTYKKNIFDKLNVKTVIDLVRIYDNLH